MTLLFEPVPQDRDAAVLHDWRRIHNLIIPTAPLSVPDVEERAGGNRLEVAYLNGVAVGNSTVRAPEHGTTVVIARVLPEHRRRGFGTKIYEHLLAYAGGKLATVVLASNEDGLRFAKRKGFVETDRYLLPGDTVAFVDLTLGVR